MDSILEILPPLQLAAVIGTAFLAALLRAFTGFGFAMIAVPVFSLLLLPAEAVVLAASLTMRSMQGCERELHDQSLLPPMRKPFPAASRNEAWPAHREQRDDLLALRGEKPSEFHRTRGVTQCAKENQGETSQGSR